MVKQTHVEKNLYLKSIKTKNNVMESKKVRLLKI